MLIPVGIRASVPQKPHFSRQLKLLFWQMLNFHHSYSCFWWFKRIWKMVDCIRYVMKDICSDSKLQTFCQRRLRNEGLLIAFLAYGFRETLITLR